MGLSIYIYIARLNCHSINVVETMRGLEALLFHALSHWLGASCVLMSKQE